MSTAAEPAPDRPLRRDAERNRRRILDAAAEVFADRGLGVTMDDVAAHAGVGVGTVYRRFANKDQLIDALFYERIDALARLGEEGLAHDDAWEGLVFFMEQAIAMQAADRGLKELLFGSGRGEERVAHARTRMAPVVFALVDRARDAGALRPDVEGPDVPVLQLMLGTAVDFSRDVEPELWRRYLTLLLDGLRVRGGDDTPLPLPALDEEQIERAMASWQVPRRGPVS